jgi:hypothetical protein
MGLCGGEISSRIYGVSAGTDTTSCRSVANNGIDPMAGKHFNVT